MKISDLTLGSYYSIKTNEKVSDIAKKFGNYRSVLVLDRKKPVGIITPIDIVKKVVMKKKNPDKILAKNIMSKPVKTASLDDDVKKISEIMSKKGYLTIPVVDKNKNIKGLISVYDVIDAQKKN